MQGGVNGIGLLFPHWEIRAQDLSHRVAWRLRDFVVGGEGHRFLHVAWRPAEIGDAACRFGNGDAFLDRKSTRLNSSHQIISYAVFCLKKKKKTYSTECPRTVARSLLLAPHY